MKAARAALGLTQADLAAAVGVTRQTISTIEAGSHNPTINLCLDICHALHTDLNSLFWKESTN
ncbi:MAG: helix-turn-helix transcriptional regulator [Propionibacteriaceae bacterium]|nr:helix-turn-helix transcriptional regulator [Propionibacteriaceae bacterium]